MNSNNDKKIRNFLCFPEKLNNLTIVLIIILYVIIGGTVSFLVSPNVNYTVVPDYSHTLYNPDFSVYTKITNNIELDSEKKVYQKGTIVVYFDNNILGEDQRVNYEFSRLDNDGSIHYLYSGKRSNYSNVSTSHTLVSGVKITTGGYNTIFGKIKYYLEPDEDEIKTYEFKEEILTLTRKELNKKVSTEKEFGDKFSFSYNLNEVGYGRSSASLNVRILTSEEKYHLDIQSFVVTTNGDIYPIIGFYGYYSDLKKTLNGYTSFDSKVDVLLFVVKANYYDENGECTTYLYKEVVASQDE